MATPICKECRFCTGIYYNGLGEISIYCTLHGSMELNGSLGPIRYEVLQCDDIELPDYDTRCWDEHGYFKSDFLPKLRNEVTLGSLYIDDYRNSFGIDPQYLCDFFEAYEIWLNEDFLDDSDEALKEWYEYSDPITTKNLIKKPINKSL